MKKTQIRKSSQEARKKPSSLVRTAAVSLNQTALDFEGNQKRILAAIKELKRQSCDLAVFPELCISSYGCEDMFWAPEVQIKSLEVLQSVLKVSKGIHILLGLPILHRSQLFNAAVLVSDGKIIGINPKKLLAKEGVHYEPRWFEPWPFEAADEILIFNQKIPIGDFWYRFRDGLGLAIEICEEAWHAEPTVQKHVRSGAHIVANLSASHFSFGKQLTREALVADASRSMQAHYIYSNGCGMDAGRIIYDGGSLIASNGKILSYGRRFFFDDFDICYADIHAMQVMVSRTQSNAGRRLRVEDVIQSKVVFVDQELRLHKKKISSSNLKKSSTDLSAYLYQADDNLDFLRASCLGLFDYLRKSKSKSYVLSLSGGCDSSVVAILVAHMLKQVFKHCNQDVDKLSKCINVKLDLKKSEKNFQSVMKKLLHCIYIETDQSSHASKKRALNLATSIHASFYTANIQKIVTQYEEIFQKASNTKISWKEDDILKQNIQARSRAPLAWLLANKMQGILLSTCNRSEAAVGYTTMDGDTAGGISPIAGVSKAFLLNWLRWAESQKLWGMGPIPSLKDIYTAEPSAELRPADTHQTDEQDLMPYTCLEKIEYYLIYLKLSEKECITQLEKDFANISKARILTYVRKFKKMWVQSQWKRERYAPTFHIDRWSLDQKTWCRFPVLNEWNALEK